MLSVKDFCKLTKKKTNKCDIVRDFAEFFAISEVDNHGIISGITCIVKSSKHRRISVLFFSRVLARLEMMQLKSDRKFNLWVIKVNQYLLWMGYEECDSHVLSSAQWKQ